MCLISIELRLFIIDLEDSTHARTHTRSSTLSSHNSVKLFVFLVEKIKTNLNQEELNSRTPSQRKLEAAGFSNQGDFRGAGGCQEEGDKEKEGG